MTQAFNTFLAFLWASVAVAGLLAALTSMPVAVFIGLVIVTFILEVTAYVCRRLVESVTLDQTDPPSSRGEL